MVRQYKSQPPAPSVHRQKMRQALRSLGQSLRANKVESIRRRKFEVAGPTRELKYLDFSNNLTNVQSTGGTPVVTALNLMAQGTDANQRIGNKFVMKSLYLRWGVQQDLTSLGTMTENANSCLVSIVYDKQPNGALPAYSTIFKVAGNNSDPYAVPDPNYQDRFEILASKLFVIGSAGPNAEGETRFIKLNHITKCNNTSASIANYVTGTLLLCAVGQSSTTAISLVAAGILRFDDE